MKTKKRLVWALVILFILSLSYSILPRLSISGETALSTFYVYNVPYVSQSNAYWCGPATLTMVLNFWNVNMSQEEIAVEIFDPMTNLTAISEMKAYVQRLGLKYEEPEGSIENLKKYVSRGFPVIVLQKYSLQSAYGHYRVVVGYDDENRQTVTLDPILGHNYNITYTEFAELWKPGATFTTFNWMFVVIPQDRFLVDLMGNFQFLMNQEPSLHVGEVGSTDLLNSVVTAVVTVLIGVSIYSLGQMILKFTIEPIHKQDELRGEIADALIFYANVYSNPGVSPQHTQASVRFRQLASLLLSKTRLIRMYDFFSRIGLVPREQSVLKAHSNLIGLSNRITLPQYATLNVNEADEIRELLRV